MRFVRTVLPAFALCLAFAARAAVAQEPPGEWKPLFDGKTLDGWHHFGEGKWVVEDGAIVGRTERRRSCTAC